MPTRVIPALRRPKEQDDVKVAAQLVLPRLHRPKLEEIYVTSLKSIDLECCHQWLDSVPLLCALMHIARNHAVMGKFVIPNKLFIAGWLTTGLMTAAAILTVVHLLASSI